MQAPTFEEVRHEEEELGLKPVQVEGVGLTSLQAIIAFLLASWLAVMYCMLDRRWGKTRPRPEAQSDSWMCRKQWPGKHLQAVRAGGEDEGGRGTG
eukprot:762604-Hanusia_phi.AAC.5